MLRQLGKVALCALVFADSGDGISKAYLASWYADIVLPEVGVGAGLDA